MGEQVELILGFDPGGKEHFGWSVCKVVDGELRLLRFGVADDAKHAICKVKKVIEPLGLSNAKVMAAGIDAPMFWSAKRNREIDGKIGAALLKASKKECPPKEKKPSVLAVNSLRGACTVQGVLLGKHLCKEYPNLRTEAEPSITETHPGALRYLLREARKSESDELEKIIKGLEKKSSVPKDHGSLTKRAKRKYEDQRDATISAYAAWQMYRHKSDQSSGWRNLYGCDDEPGLVKPFDTPVSYWMPIFKDGEVVGK